MYLCIQGKIKTETKKSKKVKAEIKGFQSEKIFKEKFFYLVFARNIECWHSSDSLKTKSETHMD